MEPDTLYRFDQVLRSRALGGRHAAWVEWDLLSANAVRHGGRAAFIDTWLGTGDDARRGRTWAEALEDVNTIIVNLLDRGARKGGTVVSQLPAVRESTYLDLVTSKLSQRHLALSLDLGPAETEGVLRKLAPEVAVMVPEWHGRDVAAWYQRVMADQPGLTVYALVRPGEPVPEGCRDFQELLSPAVWDRYRPDDLAYLKTDPLDVHELLPTSGTTGIPKISRRTTLDWFQVHSVCIAERAGHTVYDTRLLMGPLAGGSGRLWGVHVPLYTAGTSVYLTEFDEEAVLDLTERLGVTIWTWNPALLTRVVTNPGFAERALPTLRQVSYSGAPLPGEVSERLRARGVVPFNVYGTSEVGGCMSPILPGISEEHLASAAGVPFEGFDVPVVDADGERLPPGEVGEILIWNVHHGYLGSPEDDRATFHDEEYGGRWEGYQHTGDLGMYDRDGYLRVMGRKKDMILRGGQNIFPKEIEDWLGQHAAVRDVAVVAMPDPVLGERACAVVVPNPGYEPTVADFQQFLELKGVAKFKWPERVELLHALPLGPGGKVLKGELREWVARRVGQSG
jgi:acyl-coenzyme A synthetase/AMP-(fatty) acid ligase